MQYISLIYKHKDKQNSLSHNNLSFFQGKFTPLFFGKIEPQFPSSLKSEGDLAMINRNRLILLPFGKRENTVGDGIILGENPMDTVLYSEI